METADREKILLIRLIILFQHVWSANGNLFFLPAGKKGGLPAVKKCHLYC